MQVDYVLVLTIGIALGFLLLAAQSSRLLSSDHLKIVDESIIYGFLPAHVALTQAVLGEKMTNLALAAAFGAYLPLLVLLFATYFHLGRQYVYAPLAAASFGGGNRGVFLITIAMLIAAGSEGSWLARVLAPTDDDAPLLDYFVVMDFAYFFVFSMILAPTPLPGGVVGHSARLLLKKLFKPMIAISIVVGFAFLVPKSSLTPDAASWWRGHLSTGLALTATAIMVARYKSGLSIQLLWLVFGMLAARMSALLVFGAIAFLAYEMGNIEWRMFEKLLLVFLVFLLVPPSSYISSFIGTESKVSDVDDINRVNMLWNGLFYFGAIAVGIFALSDLHW
jgi:hypothetical protein